MRNKGLWYVGGGSIAIAAMLAYGSVLSDLASWPGRADAPVELQRVAPAASDAMRPGETTPAASERDPKVSQLPQLSVQWQDVAQAIPARDTLHWHSLGFGILIGIVLTLLAQVSWFELPRRCVRWLAANERNFYRLGIAGACLAVLLFY